jgi:predicted alpha/beta hydrolase family esterase
MPSSSSSKNSTTVRSRKALRWARAALHTAYIVSEDLGTSLAERLFVTPRKYRRPARERAVLATAKAFQIPVELRSPRWAGHGHTHVAAWRWGIGPTVLLVHGWEGRGSQLGAFVEPLVAAGLSVVAFDAPAHGDSPGSRLYLTDHADALADVVTAIGPVHATIAHSFGAAAVLVAHQRHGVDISRNVMIAPNVVIEEAVERFARTLGLDATDRILFEHQLVTHSGVPLASLRLDVLAGNRDAGLLIFHDPDDTEVPFSHAEQLVATWPGAQLREATGLGHRRVLRDEGVIAEAVEHVARDIAAPASDLVREVDKTLASLDLALS